MTATLQRLKRFYTIWACVCVSVCVWVCLRVCVRVLPGHDLHCLLVVWKGSLLATDDCCLPRTSSHSSEHLHINTNANIFTMLSHTCTHTHTHRYTHTCTHSRRSEWYKREKEFWYRLSLLPTCKRQQIIFIFPLDNSEVNTYLQCRNFWWTINAKNSWDKKAVHVWRHFRARPVCDQRKRADFTTQYVDTQNHTWLHLVAAAVLSTDVTAVYRSWRFRQRTGGWVCYWSSNH